VLVLVHPTVHQMLALEVELVMTGFMGCTAPGRVETLFLQLPHDCVADARTKLNRRQRVVEVLGCGTGARHEQDVAFGGQCGFQRAD